MNEGLGISRGYTRRSVFGLSGMAVLVAMTAGNAMAIERADQVGKPLRDNLRATVASVARQGGTVHIRLVLRWAGPNRNWAFDTVTSATVYFWSGPKARQPGGPFVLQKIPLDPNFATGETTAMIDATIPASAKWLSVALGTSGLETEAKAIP
jgi:hypothetical protein